MKKPLISSFKYLRFIFFWFYIYKGLLDQVPKTELNIDSEQMVISLYSLQRLSETFNELLSA